MTSLVTVSTHSEALDAHILRNRLEVEGIPATIADENHVTMNWLLSPALGGVKIQVPDVFVEQALKVIADSDAGLFALPDTEEVYKCPSCCGLKLTRPTRSKKVAFLGLFIFSVPLPFSHHDLRCEGCGWTGTLPDQDLD
jgi:predicted RNA-binding Zn-ribbon protein involved in translation (DUF1610 family)